MNGFLTALCTLAAFGMIGWGILSAVSQLIHRDDELTNYDNK